MSKEIVKDPIRLDKIDRLIRYTVGFSLYENTFDAVHADLNDFKKEIDLKNLRVPSLIVHGDMDGDVPFSQAQ